MPTKRITKRKAKAANKNKRQPAARLGVEIYKPTQPRGVYDYSNDRLLPMEPAMAEPKKTRARRGYNLVYDNKGSSIGSSIIRQAMATTNAWLTEYTRLQLPLARTGKRVSALDVLGLKAIGNLIGRAMCHHIQDITWHDANGLRNTPVDRGCPDLVPAQYVEDGKDYDWPRFKKGGIEVKVTCGSLKKGSTLRYDESRLEYIGNNMPWGAHHNDSTRMLGLLWDYVDGVAQIVGAFYSNRLRSSSYGETKPNLKKTSGNTTNRGGLNRAAQHTFQWVCVRNDKAYVDKIRKMLPECGL